MKKEHTYIIEYILLALLMTVFRLLPVDYASAFGGWVARMIGGRLGVSKRAAKHLEIAFPGMPAKQKKVIVRDMWDNLGRVIGEYPHLAYIGANRVTVVNEGVIKDVLSSGRGGIFVSAHIGNWETHVPGMLARYGIAACLTYRHLNNPYADNLLKKFRTLNGKIKAYPKARESGKQLIMEIKNKNFLAILVDQKYNEGIPAPFFGRLAMTNPVFAQLAQKYECPLVMVRCKRLKGAHFEITARDPLKLVDDSGNQLPVVDVVTEANRIMEEWIKDSPGQWLWLHRRWDSAQLKSTLE